MPAPEARPPGDRSGTILTLGIIQIVLGGTAALLAVVTVVAMAVVMNEKLKGAGASPAMIAPALIYLVPAANLLATGIGSVRFAAWARLATMISAVAWLVLALALAAAFAVGGPVPRFGVGKNEATLMLVVLLPLMLVMIAFPILLVAMYASKGVRDTFARRARR